MKRASILSHGLAVAVGLLVAATVLPRPGSGGNTAEVTGPELSAKSAARAGSAKASGPREILEELSHMPMDPIQRSNLKGELWSEWTKADPEGVLRQLQGRAWPDGCSYFYGPKYAFLELAKRNPEALIDYARREGCGDAWSALCNSGDPRRILPLLLAKGDEEPLPASIFGTLFGRGLAVDSSFQNEFSKLEDPERRKAAFAAISAELLERQRLDDYFRFIGEAGMDAAVIGKEYGSQVGDDERLIAEIAHLPEDARTAAMGGVVDGFAKHGLSSAEETMETLANLNATGWWGWPENDPEWQGKLRHLMEDTIWSGDGNDDEWCDWALKLPEGEVARFMKTRALHRWANRPGPDWQPRLAAITDPALHDMAAATLALGLPGEEEASAVVGMIADGELRRKTAEELQSRKERGEERDPFGRSEEWDPFAGE